jgi:5-methyltetrahydrofolate--homocysteine methyltransferase
MPGGVCPELWCLEHPEIIKEIHRSSRQAVQTSSITCTFGAKPLQTRPVWDAGSREINRSWPGSPGMSVGPKALGTPVTSGTDRPFRWNPFGDLPFEEAVAAFKEQGPGAAGG